MLNQTTSIEIHKNQTNPKPIEINNNIIIKKNINSNTIKYITISKNQTKSQATSNSINRTQSKQNQSKSTTANESQAILAHKHAQHVCLAMPGSIYFTNFSRLGGTPALPNEFIQCEYYVKAMENCSDTAACVSRAGLGNQNQSISTQIHQKQTKTLKNCQNL